MVVFEAVLLDALWLKLSLLAVLLLDGKIHCSLASSVSFRHSVVGPRWQRCQCLFNRRSYLQHVFAMLLEAIRAFSRRNPPVIVAIGEVAFDAFVDTVVEPFLSACRRCCLRSLLQ